jgi:hypothetical protein
MIILGFIISVCFKDFSFSLLAEFWQMEFVSLMQYNVIIASMLYKFFPVCRLIFQTLKFPSKNADEIIITSYLSSKHHGNVTT